MANQGKRMVKENLIAQIGEIPEYTGGTGIDITNETISVDTDTVALKSELFSGDYDDLTNKPDLSVYELAADAFSGDYDDLTDKPDLNIYAQSANLATVATTGAYSDLTGTPTIPAAVSGTNDGTNWTSLTVGSDTYAIPQGGSGEGLPTYGLGIEDLPEGSTTFDLPLATLIAAGLPILASDYTSAADYIYKDNVVDIEVGSYFNIHGMIAMATDTTGGLRFYSTSNNGITTNKQVYTIQAYRTGGKEYTFNYARYRARLSAYEIDSENLTYVYDMVASTDGIVGISGNPDNEAVNITYTYMTVNNPQPNVRYRAQLAAPTADGTYTLKATIANGVTTFSWVLDQA